MEGQWLEFYKPHDKTMTNIKACSGMRAISGCFGYFIIGEQPLEMSTMQTDDSLALAYDEKDFNQKMETYPYTYHPTWTARRFLLALTSNQPLQLARANLEAQTVC